MAFQTHLIIALTLRRINIGHLVLSLNFREKCQRRLGPRPRRTWLGIALLLIALNIRSFGLTPMNLTLPRKVRLEALVRKLGNVLANGVGLC